MMETKKHKRRRPHVAAKDIHDSHTTSETTTGVLYCKNCMARFEVKLKAPCEYEPKATEYYAGWPV